MAARYMNTVRSIRKEVVLQFGSVTFGSSGAISSYATGTNFTLTRTGTGAYTMTLTDKFHSLLSITGTVVNSSAEDGHWQRTAAMSGGNTITLLHVAGGAAADPASGTSVDFFIALKNSGVFP